MPRLINHEDLMKRVGRIEQVAEVRRFQYSEGKAKGVEGIDVRTGGGLAFTVIPDRALDIFDCRYRSKSLCWQSSTGVVGPAYYEREGSRWLQGFGGGMLVTCGLRNVGSPSENGGRFGMHGEISYTPATNVGAVGRWKRGRYRIEISGTVRETSAFGSNLVMRRTIRTELGATHLVIEDLVSNQATRPEGFMQLYHFNVGYPFLGPGTRVYLAAKKTIPRDAEDPRGTMDWDRFGWPEDGFKEQVFLHQLSADRRGMANVVLVSDDDAKDWGVRLKYREKELPWLMQWKQQGEAEYVLGLEPANCTIFGREHDRKKGLLRYLSAGDSCKSRVVLEVLPNESSIKRAIAAIHELR